MRVALVSHSSTFPILKVKDEIRSVGVKYQLATKFTSFVGVDRLRSVSHKFTFSSFGQLLQLEGSG